MYFLTSYKITIIFIVIETFYRIINTDILICCFEFYLNKIVVIIFIENNILSQKRDNFSKKYFFITSL
jgi:hypothetical protein